MQGIDEHLSNFERVYGQTPEFTAYAPGRVNIIGAHTDYNCGLVLAAAIPLGTTVSVRRNSGCMVNIVSDQQPASVSLPPGQLPHSTEDNWARYVAGVLVEMEYNTVGLDIFVSSDLPMRRGLASSAALTVATAMSIAHVTGAGPDMDLALLCQRVEHTYLQVQCGILDQYIALNALPSQLLLIDCNDLTHNVIPFSDRLRIVICNSGIGRTLLGSHYNLRRSECLQAARATGRDSLRGMRLDELEAIRDHMPVQAKRAEHVLNENERVIRFSSALKSDDFTLAGQIMAEAHASARDLLDCSIPEIDFLVDAASALPGCIGARLTGAGWGGATINLVESNFESRFCEALGKAYRMKYAHDPSFFVVSSPGAGAYGVVH